MKVFLSLILSCVVLLAGCDLFKNEQTPLSGELVPLSVGNYWEYHVSF